MNKLCNILFYYIYKMDFNQFGFGIEIKEGLEIMGFKEATPIQKKAIPIIQSGKDLIACAQTGTGKTAAFVLPILDKICKENLSNKVKTIIISPTRELAKQIDRQIEGFSYFTNNSSYPIYGGGTGVEYENQKKALVNGTDIIICTPGRLIAHLDFKYFDTSQVQHLILDEADKMLDMGFYDDIIKITKKLPKNRQTLLFSATMPEKIRKLSEHILNKPKSISLSITKPAEGISQSAYLVYDNQKNKLIQKIVSIKEKEINNILIFASSIKNVKEINYSLNRLGIKSAEMHSNLTQEKREDTIRYFKNKKIKILIATDILSRGIDIKDIDLVINYEVPNDPEDYIHRIGRTARAKRKGEAITFINEKQIKAFMKIENIIEKNIDKLILPDNIGKGPIYKIIEKKKKRYRNKNKK